jgi:two-component system CheB/CheR fusion protein
MLMQGREAPAPRLAIGKGGLVAPKKQDRASDKGKAVKSGDVGDSVASLKRDLRAKEKVLQAANRRLEESNAELKSSSEEMQSVNEELQSTNEELETSKEELQSVNEELTTVNAEMLNKVADLSRSNNDMNNLLSGTGIGTVFVDHQLRILRYTPAATRIINLIPGDLGRPVAHIVNNLAGYNRLAEDVQAVLDTLAPREAELRAVDGRWYTMRILPYRTLENVIEGAVITFVDITEMKQTEAALNETRAILNAALDNIHVGIAIAEAPSGSLRTLNGAARAILGGNRSMDVRDVRASQYASTWNLKDLAGRPLADDQVPLARAVLLGEACSCDLAIPRSVGEMRIVRAKAAPVKDERGAVVAAIMVLMDVTGRRDEDPAAGGDHDPA